MTCKVSVVTVCRNAEATISATIRSVALQTYSNYEHVIVDGCSTDATVEIVRRATGPKVMLISEPDDGLYDAMNKGVRRSLGDAVSFLNADDTYADANVLADVAEVFSATNADFVYGDLLMVDSRGRIQREWKAGKLSSKGLTGSQLPHPSLFIKREVLSMISPPFDPTYRIAADLKQQLTLINKMHAVGVYLRRPLVRMALGGTSTSSAKSYIQGWRESRRAYNELFGRGGTWFTVRKVLSKVKSIRLGRVSG
jgi:glycosyltransferase involved in cell wall biosynthesis